MPVPTPPLVTIRSSDGVAVEIAGLSPHEHVWRQLQRTGRFYEADLLDAVAALPLDPDAVCIDVGANLGNHTLYLAAVLGRRVIAVEPEPRNAALLRANVARNGVGDRVEVVEAALGAAPGRAGLHRRLPDNAGTFATGPGDDVAVVTLEDLVPDEVRVGLLKVDVEGDELAVLDGARRRLERDRPIVAVEAHTPAAAAAITARLAPLGYEVLGVHGLSDNLLLAASDAPIVRLEPTVVAHDRALQRSRQREVLDELRKLPDRVSAPPALLTELERRGHELERVRRQLAQLEQRLDDEATFARRTATSNRQLRRETDLWREAYESVTRSRALRAARRVRSGAARLHLATELTPLDAADRARGIRRTAAKGVTTPTSRPPRSRGIDLRSAARPPVRVGIASMPSRVEGLRAVVTALRDQVDEVCVYLNDYPEVPDFLDDPAITVVAGDDVGDRGKFAFVDGFEGYYLTADDDIAYPPYYVEHLIDGIERYGRRAAVGWHGSVIKTGFRDYYEASSRWVLAFQRRRAHDTPVHILGTGCSAFHTDTLRVRYADFEHPNVADVHLARLGQHQRVPFVVLRHPADAARPLPLAGGSISDDSMSSQGRLDVRERTNRLVHGHGRWRVHRAEPVVTRPELRVAVIGRVDTERWRKGGILRSCHMTARMLARFGVEVDLIDLVSDGPERQRDVDADAVLIYPGDPERPDFAPVEDLVAAHAAAGRLVLVNLSYDGRPSRTHAIVQRLRHWELTYPGRVRMLAFTDELTRVPELAPVRDLIVALPKTIAVPAGRTADFASSAGIFLGDHGKLCEEGLFDHPVEDWIAAIRRAVPEAPLFALAQYQPRTPKDLDLEVRPYVPGPLAEDLANVRLMVSPLRFCTFEMVPVELAGAGIPVVYRGMEQSLSSYLGGAGVPVTSPDDLASVLPTLYRDPSVWAGYARAGQLRARSADQQHAAAALYLHLRAAIERSAPAVAAEEDVAESELQQLLATAGGDDAAPGRGVPGGSAALDGPRGRPQAPTA